MKKLLLSFVSLLAIADAVAQNNGDQLSTNSGNAIVPASSEPMGEIIFPILFMSFLVFMLISVVKYFLEFRLKNKMIDRGMTEQILAFNKNDDNKFDAVIKLAILFCGLGMGLAITYLAGPITILSIAIMAFSIGLSYFAYFFYLRKQKK